MPVARIVTRTAQPSPEIEELSRHLRAGGYDVVIGPGMVGPADLVIEADELSAREALQEAVRLSGESGADVYVAPGLISTAEIGPSPAAPVERQSSPPEAERAGVLGTTWEELHGAWTDSRTGVRDAISGWRARAQEAWSGVQRQRMEAARKLRMERERRMIEREQRRREHELELQRRAEEKERILAEREREAAAQERALREQMTREAAIRAESEQIEREAMAREAARRAESERAEQEQRRLAALDAERLRREEQVEAAPVAASQALPEVPQIPAAEPAWPAPAPKHRMRQAYPRRRIATHRERQWQRAALIASIATLAAMLGFAIAASVTPSSPIPQSVQQNRVRQEIPFGPARMDASSAESSPRTAARSAAMPLKPPTAAPPKPSAATPVTPRQARSRDADVIAEDEVIVHRLPRARAPHTQGQRAAAGGGVRRYSDEN